VSKLITIWDDKYNALPLESQESVKVKLDDIIYETCRLASKKLKDKDAALDKFLLEKDSTSKAINNEIKTLRKQISKIYEDFEEVFKDKLEWL